MNKLRRVIVETPYAGKTEDERRRNLAYARACARDSLINHGESPFLSHLLYTQPGILDDWDPIERLHGIEAGLTWGEVAEATIVYIDLSNIAPYPSPSSGPPVPTEFNSLSLVMRGSF